MLLGMLGGIGLASVLALAAIVLAIALGVTGGTGAESLNVRDSGAAISMVLPSAASTTVTSTGFDTGETTPLAVQPGNFEFLLTAPALSTTILPDTKTMTYSILAADDAAMSVNVTVLVTSAIAQVGAGGVGAAKATCRYRLPSVCQRYIGFKAVSGANTTDASALSGTLEALF